MPTPFPRIRFSSFCKGNVLHFNDTDDTEQQETLRHCATAP